MRHLKPMGHSEAIARLRKSEGWNDKRFALPVVQDFGEERSQCYCRTPADNDQGVCMDCGGWIGCSGQS